MVSETVTTFADLRLVETPSGVRVEVRAKPRARKSALVGVREGALEVALGAPPVDGAANAELVAFLARVLGCAKRDVVLLRGEGSRTKLVEVRGLAPAAIVAALASARE